jgi:hypothetical protein
MREELTLVLQAALAQVCEGGFHSRGSGEGG